jgi:hypothetical protein
MDVVVDWYGAEDDIVGILAVRAAVDGGGIIPIDRRHWWRHH